MRVNFARAALSLSLSIAAPPPWTELRHALRSRGHRFPPSGRLTGKRGQAVEAGLEAQAQEKVGRDRFGRAAAVAGELLRVPRDTDQFRADLPRSALAFLRGHESAFRNSIRLRP